MTDAPSKWAEIFNGYTVAMTGLPREDGHHVAITCGELRSAATALTTAKARIDDLESALADTKEALRIVTWNRDRLVEHFNLKPIYGPENKSS